MILNEPYNGFSLPLGVIRDHDGTYANGKYDAVLPSNLFTWQIGWTHAAGFYLALGYRAGLWRSNNGSNNWEYQGLVEAGPSGTVLYRLEHFLQSRFPTLLVSRDSGVFT